MRRVLLAASVASFMIAPAMADPNSAANVSDNASPMGEERAERNSAGGDREKGGFGEAQSSFVTENYTGPDKESNYGQDVAAPFANKNK